MIETSQSHPSRRRTLKTLLGSGALLSLDLLSRSVHGAAGDGKSVNALIIGDFGTTGAAQKKVAETMAKFCQTSNLTPDCMLLLGDNFYAVDKGKFSVDSTLWKEVFEDMYPASVFPGPFYAVLGNHDYSNNIGGEKVQLEYSKKPGTRWKMPAKWFRFELGPEASPYATVIALDSNTVGTSRNKKTGKTFTYRTKKEAAEQDAWLKEELAKPRAPFTIVMSHFPLYSNGSHKDTQRLIDSWGPLFQEHKVHAYLAGHDHDLQHIEIDGKFTSFLLAGAGGATTRPVISTKRPIPYGEGINGFLHMNLSADKILFTYHNAKGEVVHKFTKSLDGSVQIG